MFGIKPKRPEPQRLPQMTPPARAGEDYAQLAKKLDVLVQVEYPETDMHRLLRELSILDIPTYDYREVGRWLKSKLRWSGEVWFWRPLRDRDSNRYAHAQYNGQISSLLYGRAVPYETLKRVEKVLQALPEARFYVSDYGPAERPPDPFLAVRWGNSDLVVIDFWDEPGFGD